MNGELVDWDAYTQDMGATGFPGDLLLQYAGKRILDIGCGIGHHLSILGTRNLRVGLDISLGALKRAQALSDGVFFSQANAYYLPFRSHSWDTILLIDVIEHLEYPSKLLREMARLLQVNGLLILQTPNYPIKRLYDVVNYLKPHGWRKSIRDDPTHVSKLSWWRLESLIAQDFVIVDSRARNILLESKLPFLKHLRRSFIGKLIGQKTIVVAAKPE